MRTGTKKIDDLQGEDWCVVRGLTNVRYDTDVLKKEDEDLNEKVLYFKKLLTAGDEQYSDLVKEHREFLALNDWKKIGT